MEHKIMLTNNQNLLSQRSISAGQGLRGQKESKASSSSFSTPASALCFTPEVIPGAYICPSCLPASRLVIPPEGSSPPFHASFPFPPHPRLWLQLDVWDPAGRSALLGGQDEWQGNPCCLPADCIGSQGCACQMHVTRHMQHLAVLPKNLAGRVSSSFNLFYYYYFILFLITA